jgi:hypothetical protein
MAKLLNVQKLIEYHDKYMQGTDGDKDYLRYKPLFCKFDDFNKVSGQDFVDVPIKFANAWKSRTCSSIEIAENVVMLMKKHNFAFQQLKGKSLQSMDLDIEEENIKTCYNVMEKVNPTAISKILHMMNEKIFPIWDDRIRKKYGVYGNAEGYLTFVMLVQRQLSKLGVDSIKQIEKTTERAILKILDEYNWYLNNRE